MLTPQDEEPDPFEEFNSVTLHHDGDDGGYVEAETYDVERERERERQLRRERDRRPKSAGIGIGRAK